MKITLEMIDELRKQKNISYNQAKDALEQTDGDLGQTIILLEKSTTNELKDNKSNNLTLLVIILGMIFLSFLIIGLINNISIFIPFLI